MENITLIQRTVIESKVAFNACLFVPLNVFYNTLMLQGESTVVDRSKHCYEIYILHDMLHTKQWSIVLLYIHWAVILHSPHTYFNITKFPRKTKKIVAIGMWSMSVFFVFISEILWYVCAAKLCFIVLCVEYI